MRFFGRFSFSAILLSVFLKSASLFAHPSISFFDFEWAQGSQTPEFAANESSYLKSVCLKKSLKDLEPYITEQLNQENSLKKHLSFMGLHLYDHSRWLDLLPLLIRPSTTHDNLKSARENNCESVRCVLKSVLGESQGDSTLFTLAEFGFNTSYLSQEPGKFKPFSNEEFEDAVLPLFDLPKALLAAEHNRPLLIANNSKNPLLHANASIHLFEAWQKSSRAERRVTLMHELGHVLGSLAHLDLHHRWLELSQWRKIESPHSPTSESLFGVQQGYFARWEAMDMSSVVSEYGASNPSEDFAESFVAYRYNPHYLQAQAPQKYAFLKKYVFHGLEFSSRFRCDSPLNLTTSSLKTTLEAQRDLLLKKNEISLVTRNCGEFIFKDSKKSLPEKFELGVLTQKCLQRGLLTHSSLAKDPIASSPLLHNLSPEGLIVSIDAAEVYQLFKMAILADESQILSADLGKIKNTNFPETYRSFNRKERIFVDESLSPEFDLFSFDIQFLKDSLVHFKNETPL